MNNIYKVVWNAGLQMFQVVSELAKGKSKSKRCRSQVLTHYLPALTFSSLFLFSTNSFAADSEIEQLKQDIDTLKQEINTLKTQKIKYVSVKSDNTSEESNVNNDGAKKLGSIAIGDGALANIDNSISIGKNAGKGSSSSENGQIGNIFLGYGAGENSKDSINVYIGYSAGSNASGHNNLAYGNTAGKGIKGDHNIGIGFNSSLLVSGNNNVALGQNSGTNIKGINNTSIGSMANNFNKTTEFNYSVALGFQSETTASKATALGPAAKAKQEGALAIGFAAKANAVNSVSIGTGASSKENAVNSVSIGTSSSSNIETSVALGFDSVSNRSIDTIGYDFSEINTKNGSFVGDIKTEIDRVNGEISPLEEKINELQAELSQLEDKKKQLKNENNTTELGVVENKITQNRQEIAEKKKELNKKQVEKNKIRSTWKGTLGAVSIGDTQYGETRQIISVAAGTEDTDAVNVAQLKSLKNAGLTFALNDYDKDQADSTKDKLITKEIGSIFQIQGKSDLVYNDANKAKYTSDNLVTFNDAGVLRIGMLKSPSFTGVTLGEGDKTVSLTADDGVLKAGGKTIFTEDNFKMFFTKLYTFEGGLKTEDKDGKTVVSLDKETIKQMPELKGEKGDAGKSAYEIWKAQDGNGNKSETDFTNAIKGEKGDAGKSAYEIWKAQDGNGNKSEADFTNAIKGEKGDAGKSAYEIWKAQDGNGNKSETDFTNAIKGEKGDAGKSAYEIWKAQDGNGNKSEADFTNAIKGEKGDAGKSAYEIWKAQDGNGNKSETDFTNAIKGEKGDAGKSAYEIWKAQDGNGNKSETDFTNAIKGEKGEKGDAGKSAYEVWKAQAGNENKSETDFTNAIKGEKGDAGKSAYEVWKAQAGNENKSETDFTNAIKGEKGDTGLSAKAQWLVDNPDKTDADYAAAMKGEKGEQGLKGEKGKSAYESWKKLPANQGKSETEFAEMLGGGASKVELQQLRTEHDSLKAQIRKDQQSIQQLDRNMQKMNKDLRAGIAGATAIAFLQGGNFAGESAVSVAVGTYKGEHALAVGYGRRLTNNKIEIKLGASVNSQSDVNAGGSVGYHW